LLRRFKIGFLSNCCKLSGCVAFIPCVQIVGCNAVIFPPQPIQPSAFVGSQEMPDLILGFLNFLPCPLVKAINSIFRHGGDFLVNKNPKGVFFFFGSIESVTPTGQEVSPISDDQTDKQANKQAADEWKIIT